MRSANQPYGVIYCKRYLLVILCTWVQCYIKCLVRITHSSVFLNKKNIQSKTWPKPFLSESTNRTPFRLFALLVLRWLKRRQTECTRQNTGCLVNDNCWTNQWTRTTQGVVSVSLRLSVTAMCPSTLNVFNLQASSCPQIRRKPSSVRTWTNALSAGFWLWTPSLILRMRADPFDN